MLAESAYPFEIEHKDIDLCIKYIIVHSSNNNHPSIKPIFNAGIYFDTCANFNTKHVMDTMFGENAHIRALVCNLVIALQNYELDKQILYHALANLLDNNLNNAQAPFFVKVMIVVIAAVVSDVITTNDKTNIQQKLNNLEQILNTEFDKYKDVEYGNYTSIISEFIHFAKQKYIQDNEANEIRFSKKAISFVLGWCALMLLIKVVK